MGYKNYVGTVGADWEPMLIADRVSSPPDFAWHYTERLILMPHSFYGALAMLGV